MRLFILILFNLLVSSNIYQTKENIIEEVKPIRIEDKIKAINYNITINNSNRKKIIYNTKIIDSINHYLDVSKKDKLVVRIKFNNKTEHKYYLKKIVIYDTNKIIKIYNYNKLVKNTNLNVNLSKETLNKVIKNSKVTGTIKIIIEK